MKDVFDKLHKNIKNNLNKKNRDTIISYIKLYEDISKSSMVEEIEKKFNTININSEEYNEFKNRLSALSEKFERDGYELKKECNNYYIYVYKSYTIFNIKENANISDIYNDIIEIKKEKDYSTIWYYYKDVLIKKLIIDERDEILNILIKSADKILLK